MDIARCAETIPTLSDLNGLTIPSTWLRSGHHLNEGGRYVTRRGAIIPLGNPIEAPEMKVELGEERDAGSL